MTAKSSEWRQYLITIVLIARFSRSKRDLTFAAWLISSSFSPLNRYLCWKPKIPTRTIFIFCTSGLVILGKKFVMLIKIPVPGQIIFSLFKLFSNREK